MGNTCDVCEKEIDPDFSGLRIVYVPNSLKAEIYPIDESIESEYEPVQLLNLPPVSNSESKHSSPRGTIDKKFLEALTTGSSPSSSNYLRVSPNN